MNSDATNGLGGTIPNHWRAVVSKYAEWIDAADFHAAKHWCERLGGKDKATLEGAVAEAIAWEWLRHRVDHVALGGASGQRAPDFFCAVNEATSLSR